MGPEDDINSICSEPGCILILKKGKTNITVCMHACAFMPAYGLFVRLCFSECVFYPREDSQ